MRGRSSAPPALAFGLVGALAGCSGGSGGSAAPAPIATTRPASFSVSTATRGTLQLALNAINLDEFYARFLRPGVGTVFGGALPQSAPACSASSATATQSTGSVVITAFYPAGDTSCSQSPTRILVVDYSGTTGSRPTAYGYQIIYAQQGDPTVAPGAMVDFEQFEAVLYDVSGANASLNLADTESMSAFSSAYPTSPPSPGTFPATFPVGLPIPSTVSANYVLSSSNFAVTGTAASSRAGTLSLGSYFINPFAVVTNLQNVGVDVRNDFNVHASAPDANGDVTLSWSSADTAYGIDPLPDEPAYTSAFPLAPSTVTWPLPSVGALGMQTSVQNFPAPSTGSATYARDGSLLSCSHTITDAVNAVSAKALCSKGGKEIDLTVTDLHAAAPATKPATIVIDSSGNGVNAGLTSAYSYTVNFDGSRDQISAFTIQPAQ